MAIVHCDNFSIYGGDAQINNMLNNVYAELHGFSHLTADPDGVSTGTVFNMEVSGGLRYVLAQSRLAVGYCCRLWQKSLPTTDGYAQEFDFRDGNNFNIARLYITTTGGFTFINSVTGATVTTPNPAIGANGWWHLEFKCVIDPVNGSFEVRVEGVTVLKAINQNLGNSAIAAIDIAHNQPNNIQGTFMKDLVVWDTSGTQNNDFLGSVLVKGLLPQADVNTNWGVTGAPTRYQALDSVPPQDGAVFITAVNPPPAAQVVSLSDLDADTTSVRALMSFVRAGKSDGGDGSLQAGIISSPAAAPATVLGANRPITTAQNYWRDIFEVDPKTGNAWLPAAVNAAQLQLNRTV